MTEKQIQWPAAFIERIKLQFPDSFDLLINALSNEVKTSIRINPRKFNLPVCSESVPWCKNGYFLEKRPSFALDPLWHAGSYYVQESSSMFLEQVFRQIKTEQPKLVLDLCAAPGGKSTHLLSLLNKDDLLISNEVIRTRASILRENITKWGMSNVIISNSDGKSFGKAGPLFDVILIDAPCSGEGLFRRNPKAADEWSIDNTKLCTERQRRILSDSIPCLKENGYLIYSTCTFNPSEDEENISWLHENEGYNSIRIPLIPSWNIEETYYNDCWGYRFLPQKTKGEGFFISLLQKEEKTGFVRFPKKFKTELQPPSPFPKEWLLNSESKKIYQEKTQVKFIPSLWEKEIFYLSEKVNCIKTGTVIGNDIHKKVMPDPEFAFSEDINTEAFPSLTLSRDDALNYLGHREFHPNLSSKGWQLMLYDKIPLGFIKDIGKRYNNYYPVKWRLRLQNYTPDKLWYETE